MAETTIVVRAFNEERHIGDLLRSVRDQTCQDYEIVLVDSGSTDKTVSIARDYCDKVLEIESRDFIHITSSILYKVDHIITYDKSFKKFKEIDCLTPEEFLKKFAN